MQKNHDWEKYYRYISDCAHRNGIMSSRALAERANLSESLVSKFKVGETKCPSFDTVYALCESAGASIDAMCGLSTDVTKEIEDLKLEVARLSQKNDELLHKMELLTVQLASSNEKSEQSNDRRVSVEKVARMRFRFIVILAAALSLVLALIIAILVIDKLMPDRGWFTVFN